MYINKIYFIASKFDLVFDTHFTISCINQTIGRAVIIKCHNKEKLSVVIFF